MVTRVLKNLSIKKCGYCGLMLPILEDVGLAKRVSEGHLSIQEILLYSSVCGSGLDCIPLPGDITVEKLYTILLDMTTLAVRLNKPLSARLFPVVGKRAGDVVSFKSPYLLECRVMKA
ncbi:MAG TPA: DUF711 family protein [Thermoplasmata archaeon]|nr:DUF711 family protein [Thermoplasmata archaeon]